MNNNRLWTSLGVAIFSLILAAPIVGAMGRGRTQIQFWLRAGDPTSSRFFAKIDVSAAISSNANNTNTVTSTDTSTSTGTGTGTGVGKGDNDGDDDDDQGGNGGGKGGNKHDDRSNGKGKGNSDGKGNSNAGKHGRPARFSLAGQTVTLTIGSANFSGIADSKGRVSTPFEAKLTADGNILQIDARGLNLEELLPVDTTDGKHTVTVEIKVTATPAAAGSQALTLSDQNVTFDYRARHGRAQGRSE